MAAAVLAGLTVSASAQEPSAWWLQHYGIAPWELSIDLDGDGYTTEEEYRFGTNPWDAEELPLIIEADDEKLTFHFTHLEGVDSVLESSEDLQLWEPIAVVPQEESITGVAVGCGDLGRPLSGHA